jgi:ADP-ribosylglycohydrolase
MTPAGRTGGRLPVSLEDRALGALAGLAVGDALGMRTQMLPRATGIAVASNDLPKLVSRVEEACLVTYGTGPAIAGAGFPSAALTLIEEVNGLGLAEVTRGLLALRPEPARAGRAAPGSARACG